MTDDSRQRATALVASLSGAGAAADVSAEELMPLVYDELRGLARAFMARERPGHTLQPTALVNEAYLKLVDQSRVDWSGRTHFRAVGARMMRRVLLDHARRRGSAKRGGDRQRVTLAESLFRSTELDLDELVALNDALDRLHELDDRQAQVVEMRFFGGLKNAEVAAVLGVSERTVEVDWMHARAWLRRELSHGGAS